ncbi:SPRY domain-containing protein [Paenibacillus turicensis]|uniref:SPRY domain-containing protein n=1 Tax=Paenibacillus turicensis TaxID=160487 RepID=UPI003D2A1D06
MEIIDVTLNPNDMGSGFTLSNGNLTFSASTNSQAIRATHGRTSGKWYWEVKLDAGATNIFIGISNKVFLTNNYITTNPNWRSYLGASGNKYPESATYGTTWLVNDIIGVALDLDNGILEFYKNGVSMGISHTNVKELGEVYPTLSTAGSTNFKTVSSNFGATPFVYNLPSGFLPYNSKLSHKILLSSSNKTYSITPPIYATETAIPQMTSNTAPSGRAFASSIYGSNYEPWKVFGTNSEYASAQNTSNSGYIGYEFINKIKIGKYAISSAGIHTYAPKDWTFEGSNDGSNWTVLDLQINQTWVAVNIEKEYVIDISKINSYKMYRLNWTANNGGGTYTRLSLFKMYEYISSKLISLPNYSEQTFINHGMESPINITQLDGIKSIESNSTAHESGKKFIHTVDLSKRRVDKIILS